MDFLSLVCVRERSCFETGSCYAAYAGLKALGASNPPASISQGAMFFRLVVHLSSFFSSSANGTYLFFHWWFGSSSKHRLLSYFYKKEVREGFRSKRGACLWPIQTQTIVVLEAQRFFSLFLLTLEHLPPTSFLYHPTLCLIPTSSKL